MKNILVILAIVCSGVVLAQQETVVTGKVVGYDGKPMPKAHVHLLKAGQQKSLASVEMGKNGAFKLTTEETGLLVFQFTGVDHAEFQVPALIEKPMTFGMNIQLSTYPRQVNIAEVKIMGDFNNFNFNTAKSMQKQPDGTFTAEFETKADKVKYQIIGSVSMGRSTNGTQSEDFVYDGGGDYQSVITPKDGKIKIVFDPRKLPRSKSEPRVRFENLSASLEGFSLVLVDMQKRDQMMREAYQQAAAKKETTSPTFDWSTDLSNLSQQIKDENDPLVRKALLISYLSIPSPAKDAEIQKRALAEVEPSSPLWSLSSSALFTAVSLGPDGEAFLDKFLVENPDKSLKSSILFNRLMSAQMMKQEAKQKQFYEKLVNEYGDTPYGRMAKARFSPDAKIKVGNPVPSFSFASMEDPKMVYTKESMRGRYYLIDFWAVWCGPCVAEMENLHKAYEKFKSKNFEILSLSFDAKPDDVVKFRQDKWKMPWLHSFIEGGFGSKAADDFEVVAIPRPILVDTEGNIVATEIDLRGSNLEKTLVRFLGETK